MHLLLLQIASLLQKKASPYLWIIAECIHLLVLYSCGKKNRKRLSTCSRKCSLQKLMETLLPFRIIWIHFWMIMKGYGKNTFRGIGHTRFIPTKEQREVEEARKDLVAALYQEWQKRMRENRVIIDYLERAPRKHSPKNALISDLSGSDEQNKKTIQNAYRRLLKAGILGEKNNDNGTIETRIIVRRSNAATKLPTLPPSTYQADIYANICRQCLPEIKPKQPAK